MNKRTIQYLRLQRRTSICIVAITATDCENDT